MSDHFPPTQPEPAQPQPDWTPAAPAQPASWYRRRPGQIALAGVATTAVVVGALAVVSAADDSTSSLAPADALEHAFDTLADDGFGVTVTSKKENGSVTLVHTDEGSKVSVTTDEGVFEGVYVGERLYLHLQPTDAGKLGLDPMTTGLLSGFSSINSLLEGEWVSVTVSEDSKVLDALNELAGTSGSAADTAERKAAAEELSGSLQGIVDDLREPIAAAIAENSEITEPAGANGERHLHISLDVAELQADLEAPVASAVDDLAAAVDEFAAGAGSPVAPGGADLFGLRDELNKDRSEKADLPEVASADVYLKDGELSRIETDSATLTFDADPQVTAITGAVSLDEDLLRLLPMLAGLMEANSAFGDI